MSLLLFSLTCYPISAQRPQDDPVKGTQQKEREEVQDTHTSILFSIIVIIFFFSFLIMTIQLQMAQSMENALFCLYRSREERSHWKYRYSFKGRLFELWLGKQEVLFLAQLRIYVPQQKLRLKFCVLLMRFRSLTVKAVYLRKLSSFSCICLLFRGKVASLVCLVS